LDEGTVVALHPFDGWVATTVQVRSLSNLKFDCMKALLLQFVHFFLGQVAATVQAIFEASTSSAKQPAS